MSQVSDNQMMFKVLVSGCKKCQTLEDNVRQACQ